MAKKETPPSLEQSLEALEDLIEKMESDDLPLDESLALFEKGIQLITNCQQKLKGSEQKVQILLEQQGKDQLSDYSS